MTTHDNRTPEDIIWQELRHQDEDYPQLTEQVQADLTRRADLIMRALTLAGFDIIDILEPVKMFTRDQVEEAWNTGAELVLGDSDLGLSDSDTDLVNLVCNAIGTCLDNPETDDLDEVILACYDPELDEEDEGLSEEDANAKRVSIVKGWIDQ